MRRGLVSRTTMCISLPDTIGRITVLGSDSVGTTEGYLENHLSHYPEQAISRHLEHAIPFGSAGCLASAYASPHFHALYHSHAAAPSDRFCARSPGTYGSCVLPESRRCLRGAFSGVGYRGRRGWRNGLGWRSYRGPVHSPPERRRRQAVFHAISWGRECGSDRLCRWLLSSW